MPIFVPEVYAADLQQELSPATVAGNIANQNYTGTIAQRGDTVNVYAVQTAGATPVAADGSVNYRTADMRDMVLTIDQAEDLSVEIPFPKVFQTDADMQASFQESQLEDAQQAIDDYVLSLGSGFAAANEITTTASTASGFISVIREAKVALSNQNVPATNRWMVLSPTYAALANEYVTELSLEQASTEAIRAGFLGRVEGFDLYESTKLDVNAGKEAQLFGHFSAMTMAAQVQNLEFFPTGGTTSHNALLKGSVVFGAQVFNPARAGQILADEPT